MTTDPIVVRMFFWQFAFRFILLNKTQNTSYHKGHVSSNGFLNSDDDNSTFYGANCFVTTRQWYNLHVQVAIAVLRVISKLRARMTATMTSSFFPNSDSKIIERDPTTVVFDRLAGQNGFDEWSDYTVANPDKADARVIFARFSDKTRDDRRRQLSETHKRTQIYSGLGAREKKWP